MKLKEQLIKYVDAGYPIIFINSFEEIKTDAIIKEVMGGREGLEWNGAKGFVPYKAAFDKGQEPCRDTSSA